MISHGFRLTVSACGAANTVHVQLSRNDMLALKRVRHSIVAIFQDTSGRIYCAIPLQIYSLTLELFCSHNDKTTDK
jgi:hypothetical protein